jgi:hypothetical protein
MEYEKTIELGRQDTEYDIQVGYDVDVSGTLDYDYIQISRGNKVLKGKRWDVVYQRIDWNKIETAIYELEGQYERRR